MEGYPQGLLDESGCSEIGQGVIGTSASSKLEMEELEESILKEYGTIEQPE